MTGCVSKEPTSYTPLSNGPSSLSDLKKSWKENSGQIGDGKWGQRHLLILMISICYMVMFMCRYSFPVTLIGMVQGDVDRGDLPSTSSVCHPHHQINNTGFTNSSSDLTTNKGFDWHNDIQGHLLSANNIGFIVGNFIGGPLCGIFGPKHTMAVGLFANGLSQLASPLASAHSYWLLFCLQITQGICCLTFCVSNALMPRWIPLQERSRAGSFATIGCNIGSILGSWLSGVVNVYLGWQANFYINAAISLSFGLMWCFFVFDKPEQNSRVAADEVVFISSNIIQNEDEARVKKIPPYLSIFRSMKVWTLMIVYFCDIMGYSFFTFGYPMYLSKVHGLTTETIGLIDAIPYLTASIFTMALATLADWLLIRGWLSLTNTRKMLIYVSLVGSAIGFVVLGLVGCNYYLAGIIIVMTVTVNTVAITAEMLYSMDISPNYSGTILGLATGFAYFAGVVNSALLGNFITGNGTLAQWRSLFLIIASSMVFGAGFFGYFADCEVEHWN